MRETSFYELRTQARHYFDLVEAGETVRVLRKGRPIAEIRPIQPGVPSWKRRPARPSAVDGASVSDLILVGRDAADRRQDAAAEALGLKVVALYPE
jgi:antitoxin (DNA-binding transcriptional repressor) of toxin-antitoxin stability system